MFLFSTFFVDEYAAVKPPLLKFNCNSLSSLGSKYFKSATFYGVRSLINYSFFAVFILLSIHLSEYEFVINSLIGNFMKVFFSLAMAISLSYKYYHDYKNSHNFITQYSSVFYYVATFIFILLSAIFFFFHSFIASIYTSDKILTSG
jgi:Na+-driven multidrug efflux pump